MITCRYRRGGDCYLSRHQHLTNGKCYGCQQTYQDRILGLGDVVALTINMTPLSYLKPLVRGRSGECGCSRRQSRLNKWFKKKPDRQGTSVPGEIWIDTKSRTCGCRAKTEKVEDTDGN